MEVTEIGPGVFQARGSRTNFALIVDGGEVTAIDTGWRGDHDRFIAAFEQIGRRLADLRALLVTHGHVDHIGSAASLHADSGIPVLTHGEERPNVLGLRRESVTPFQLAVRIWQPGMLGFVRDALRSGGSKLDPVAEVVTFGDGDTLDVPGRPTVVSTPGHTTGHASFHLADRGVLVSGDALCTENVVTGESGPQLLPRIFNHDHERASASLDRLAALDAEVMLPGHGEPWHGAPADAVREARHHETARH